ncbi:flagellar basal body-associated protein FliL [Rhodovulum iodosum]|uniref:Flagellar basal body-associated protein FliL n=1 Tax=Rhodovulum iodosum TaxID=68291 RepID=A0ABV3XNP4_9RHOB|nr:hypothetical protein [Rhodovulum robiginosum]
MEVWIIPLLGLMTIGAVLAFAWSSKKKTEKRMHDPNAPKSTLAADGPDTRG